ncbi:MAG: Phenylalanine-tRNA ligase beta subunit [Candidatus Gottesmanbacteria bacterium GW2011_GWA1_44_24b]|uniref:Phenylalanine--tRNA ligase beta subunit n=2 Tax=Candidatus Gottesmaniibacteriota TaxID=1752720 RepID=A0A0G1IK35_9BACT|nr:MAG: Phenylalanine-tRNA ligase beta subunit [Candidatus Gottesmanbacteria bacterium GW2011_GWA1_44_24b]HCM82316.1 phenylalanine--tRNA ligase subunit beta [Patescibacteria group bacterium]
MNILVPDSWLRDYLKTKATPKQIRGYLSLCGPSVERINTVNKEIVYDIEVTSNRPDMMSVSGIAREASVILPRFGIKAEFVNDPYMIQKSFFKSGSKFSLSITTDVQLNPRFTAIVIDKIKNKPSPPWMQKWLTFSGMRPINSVVDITNYLMKAFGQPVHAFDYDQILTNNKGIPTMILRASKKRERITTLDGKMHTLPGDDIVIEDGSGRLIDLCGIMGGGVSHITEKTTRMVLFVQTYDPSHIRKTSMALAHRTEAASLFEKGIDTELVMPTILKGIELLTKLTGGVVASKLYDIYPKPFEPYTVWVSRKKINTYMGFDLTDNEIKRTLTPLGFTPTISKDSVTVTVPSFRKDITIDVDIIEEIARIYGYHNIKTKLPDTEPPVVFEDPILKEELVIKHALKGWGYTELVTYSMVSEELMDVFGFSKEKVYTISNPLTSEWIYMRPSLLPSMLLTIRQNLPYREYLSLFELSMIYRYRKNDIPEEHPMLIVGITGNEFYTLKGAAEALFDSYGIPFPKDEGPIPKWYMIDRCLSLGEYGFVGEVSHDVLTAMGISKPVTILELDFLKLHMHKVQTKQYAPIPKYPASYEDIALVVPEKTLIGPMISDIRSMHPLISEVTLLDRYQNTRTFHIVYQSSEKNLTADDIQPIREKILRMVSSKYQVTLKTV